MALKLPEKVVDCLKRNAGRRFTAREIAEWVVREFPEECDAKQQRSKQDARMVAEQLAAEISRDQLKIQKKNQEIKTTVERPKKYYWTDKSEEVEVQEAEQAETKDGTISPKEQDLYPLLSQYLWIEFECSLYSKKIDEKRSSNRYGPKGNKWLHPDVVGMEVLTSGWHREIKSLVKECADKKTKLWSFEVKLLLNRSNVREMFFQAVSNSSWANFGYLVVAEVAGNIKEELRILSALHGIGVIQLDKGNPAESEILIPARERSEVDWATCNRLANENKDFADFVCAVREFYQTDNPRKTHYWDIPDNDKDD